MNELTQERLKELFHYDPDTGIFTRLVRTTNNVKVGDIAGSLNKIGYLRIMIDNKRYPAHRLSFLYMDGKLPEDNLQVDHINQVKDDNRWVNLRLVTNQENHRNKPMQKNNKAGQTGVHWHKRRNKWVAQIKVDGESVFLGYFYNLDDAIVARKQAEIKYNFHKNHGTIS